MKPAPGSSNFASPAQTHVFLKIARQRKVNHCFLMAFCESQAFPLSRIVDFSNLLQSILCSRACEKREKRKHRFKHRIREENPLIISTDLIFLFLIIDKRHSQQYSCGFLLWITSNLNPISQHCEILL